MSFLFKNIDDFRNSYGGISRAMQWSVFEPLVNEAEEIYVRDWIGDEFAAEIQSAVAGNPPDMTEKMKRIIALLRSACSAYTEYVGTFRLINTITDGGKATAVPANHQAISKWAAQGSRKDALSRGYQFMEKSIAYLEENASAAEFVKWKESKCFSIKSEILVSSAEVLTRHFPHCNNSRRLFLALWPYLNRYQKIINTVVGLPTAELIKGYHNKDFQKENLEDYEREALDLARMVIVSKSVYESIPYINITEDWRVISVNDGVEDETGISQIRRNELRLLEGQNLDNAIGALRDFMNKISSADVFPDYFNSDLYAGASKHSGRAYNNDPAAKIVVL